MTTQDEDLDDLLGFQERKLAILRERIAEVREKLMAALVAIDTRYEDGFYLDVPLDDFPTAPDVIVLIQENSSPCAELPS